MPDDLPSPKNPPTPKNLTTDSLVKDIKRIYLENPAQADAQIESFLISRLNDLDWPARIERVQQAAADICGDTPAPQKKPSEELGIQNAIITKLFSLLLGRRATTTDLESKDQLESLAESLNTIFDTLNHLINVINTTLKGTSSQEETIRSLIGRSVANQSSASSMVDYLGQIEQAFLTSQKAMKAAARDVVNEILNELDPDTLDDSHMGILGKKKRLIALQDKHTRCRRWFESNRFEERLLRAFEKSCNQYFGG